MSTASCSRPCPAVAENRYQLIAGERRCARARRWRSRPCLDATSEPAVPAGAGRPAAMALPAAIEEGVALSRHTTLGTGGPARFFARPGTLADLEELLAWARGAGRRGRDDRPRLEPARARRRGRRARPPARRRAGGGRASRETILVAGGGATNAVCLHRARDAGLGGLRVRLARSPGTAGGGVRMNAGAYGRDWRAVLLDAARRRRRRARGRDGRRARPLLPSLGPRARRGRGAGARSSSRRGRRGDQGDRRASCSRSGRRRSRRRSGPSGASSRTRLHERGRRGADRGVRAEGPPDRRRRLSERHANFIENAGGATSADAVALMAEARRRVHEQFGVELEHEVRFLGPLQLPAAVGETARHGEQSSVAAAQESDRRPRPCPRGAPFPSVVRSLCRRRARLRAASACSRWRRRLRRGARDVDVRPRATSRSSAARPALQAEVRDALAPRARTEPRQVSARRVERRLAARPTCSRSRIDRDVPAHASRRRDAGAAGAAAAPGQRRWVVSARGRVLRKVTKTQLSTLPRDLGRASDAAVNVGAMLPPESGAHAAPRSRRSRASRSPPRPLVRAKDPRAHARPSVRLELRLGDSATCG